VRQDGSASVVVAGALALVPILVALTASLSGVAVARARAQAAADATALAVAQELVLPSGRDLIDVAEEYAKRNGARLISCRCEAETTEAVVTVAIDVRLGMPGGTREMQARARAVVGVSGDSTGLQPFFAARLDCLFGRVPGLWIVSGFRTHAEQAALHEAKPGLAAPPGHSMHELGLAADLGYPTERAEESAHEAAPGCGLAFPMAYEPWHVEPAA
jgi:secretion/DNA translocation related TadE-like protein